MSTVELFRAIYKQQKDWCHLCGKMQHTFVEFVIPRNAEHDRIKGIGSQLDLMVMLRDGHYHRLCGECVKGMAGCLQ